jgi:hypothetical protein
MNGAPTNKREQIKYIVIKKGNQAVTASGEIKGLTKEQVIIFLPNILISLAIDT